MKKLMVAILAAFIAATPSPALAKGRILRFIGNVGRLGRSAKNRAAQALGQKPVEATSTWSFSPWILPPSVSAGIAWLFWVILIGLLLWRRWRSLEYWTAAVMGGIALIGGWVVVQIPNLFGGDWWAYLGFAAIAVLILLLTTLIMSRQPNSRGFWEFFLDPRTAPAVVPIPAVTTPATDPAHPATPAATGEPPHTEEAPAARVEEAPLPEFRGLLRNDISWKNYPRRKKSQRS